MTNSTPIPISKSNFGLSMDFYAVLSKLTITDKVWKMDKLYAITKGVPKVGNP